MPKRADVVLTGIVPVIWGSTYYVTTQCLPQGFPITVALLRALPAGLVLFAVARRLPERRWWGKALLLGALNISIFLFCLFVAAYRLPGGVAATVAACQPLIVVFVERVLMGTPLRVRPIGAAMMGLIGVALLVLTPKVRLDPIGVAAGIAGAVSMAVGNVLSKKWKTADVSLIAFTSWQLIAGGLLLAPLALWLEPPLPTLTTRNMVGIAWLSLIGAALTYALWFRGIVRMKPAAVSALLFLSPATAVVLGWALLQQRLNTAQLVGIGVVLVSVWISQTTAERESRG